MCVCVCFSAGPVHSAVWCVYPGLLRDWQAKFPSHRSAPPPPQGVAATHTNHPGGQQERPGSLPWNQLRGYVQTGITVDDLKKKKLPKFTRIIFWWMKLSISDRNRSFFSCWFLLWASSKILKQRQQLDSSWFSSAASCSRAIKKSQQFYSL